MNLKKYLNMPSVSKRQQHLFAIAYSIKKGDKSIDDIDIKYRDKVKSLINNMSLNDLKDFAKTKTKDLPEVIEYLTFEEFVHANPGMNVPGLGDVTLPDSPGDMDSFASQKTGSFVGFDKNSKKKRKKKNKQK